jgi:Tol biopolymer transport system component
MKTCPECKRVYTDDTLNFCLEDGSWLLAERPTDEPQTAVLPAPSNEAPTRSLEGVTTEHRTGIRTADDLTPAPAIGRKLPRLAAAVAALAILITAGVLIFNYLQRTGIGVHVLRTLQVTDWPGLDDFAAISPDGKSIAYSSDHNGNFEIFVKPLTPGAREIQITSDGTRNVQPAWSPDGSRIAYHSMKRGGIWIVPASGGDTKQLTEFGTLPAWSPDGAKIAFQSYPVTDFGAGAKFAMPPSTLWTVNSAGGEEPKQVTQPGHPAGGHGAPSYSPDGKLLAFQVEDYNFSEIWSMPADGGEPNLISKYGFLPAFSRAGDTVLYSTSAIWQVRIDPDTGKASGEASALVGDVSLPYVRRVSFSADGKRMAFNTVNRGEALGSVRMKPGAGVPSASPISIVEKVTARTHQAAFSPDGKRITFSSCPQEGLQCDIWIANADGTNQTQLTVAESTELLSRWMPSGDEVIYTSNRTGTRSLWSINLNTKRERSVLDIGRDIGYYDLSPDGSQIAFNKSDGNTVNAWTVPLAGGVPRQMTFEKELGGFAAWSPDGRWLAYQAKHGDNSYIMVIPATGGDAEQITFAPGHSWVYGWAPDSDKIVFAGYRNDLWNVYWVSRTTKKELQITDYKKLNSFVRYPAWSPLDDQIVYEYSETKGNVWVADLK